MSGIFCPFSFEQKGIALTSLAGKVALVTGASRGIGKGIALGLGEAGATVYVTGRTTDEGQAAVALPGTRMDNSPSRSATAGAWARTRSRACVPKSS
ncbi:MAG TPA: SDR family NAD(P)-dependent oxidoreductase [Anaerolineales bacterium]